MTDTPRRNTPEYISDTSSDFSSLSLSSSLPSSRSSYSSFGAISPNRRRSMSPGLPQAIVDYLVNLFFENAYHFGPSFPSGDVQRSVSPPSKASPHLLLACLAFASHFSIDPTINAQRRLFYASAQAALEKSAGVTPRDVVFAGIILSRAALLGGAANDAGRFLGVAMEALAPVDMGRTGPSQRYNGRGCDILSLIQTDLDVALLAQSSPLHWSILGRLGISSSYLTSDSVSSGIQAGTILQSVLNLRGKIQSGVLSLDSPDFGPEFRTNASSLRACQRSIPSLDTIIFDLSSSPSSYDSASSSPSSPIPPSSLSGASSLSSTSSFSSSASSPAARLEAFRRNSSIHTVVLTHLYTHAGIILLHDILKDHAVTHQESMERAAKEVAKLLSALENVPDSVIPPSILALLPLAINVLNTELEADGASDSRWTHIISLSHLDVLQKRLNSMTIQYPHLPTPLI